MNIETLEKKISLIEDSIDKSISEDEVYFTLDSEILKTALTQQVKLQLKWESKLSQINALFYEADTYCEAAYSKAVENILTNSNIDYTITEAKILAQHDDNYIMTKLLVNKLVVAKKQVEGMLDALKTRNWTLKSITDLVINSCDNHII